MKHSDIEGILPLLMICMFLLCIQEDLSKLLETVKSLNGGIKENIGIMDRSVVSQEIGQERTVETHMGLNKMAAI